MIEGLTLQAFRQIAVIQAMQGLIMAGGLNRFQIAEKSIHIADALVEAMMEPEASVPQREG